MSRRSHLQKMTGKRCNIAKRSRRGFSVLSNVAMLFFILVAAYFGIWAIAVTYRESFQLIVTWFQSP